VAIGETILELEGIALMTSELAIIVMLLDVPQQEPGAATGGRAAADLSEQRQRVAKIVTSDVVEVGAGIVLGTADDHVLIGTARHVVVPPGTPRDECPEVAGITVAFPDSPEVFSEVTLAACRGDVDVAILDVTAPSLARKFSEQATLCWAEPVDQEPVHLIGHSFADHRITSVDVVLDPKFEGDSRRFRLSGRGSGQGSSGGPVLNDRGCLLGLFTSHAANASRATRTDEVLQLAQDYRLSASLIGRDTAPDRAARQRIFTDVSETLNSYLFQLEGVSAFFRRKQLLGEEITQITTDYNLAFTKWYQRRTTLSEAIASQWGRARAADFDATSAKLYALHNQVVYNQLADIVAALVANRRLSGDQRRALYERILPQLDAQLAEARPLVEGLLERMKPLLSSGG
jgi:hypothetical protein